MPSNTSWETAVTPTSIRPLAITQCVERDEKREAFRHDTLKAWEAYRVTGQHVTAEEADAWLMTLEQGNDLEPSECHA
jgi:predicted transcriptional regulator